MPGLIIKRNQKRWRGQIMVNGTLRQKLFPDDTKKSYREAMAWENDEKIKLEKELTVIDSWTIFEWAESYLDDAKKRFVYKTYDEKRRAFTDLLKMFPPELSVEDLSSSQIVGKKQINKCMIFLSEQAEKRSGYAANKDRKNLAVAWKWGRKYLSSFPRDTNPFRAVDKFPEERSERYVPPEEDFWKVYDVAEGQDKVMLLTFLHLAARRGEIFGLTWSDIDFERSQVRLWTNKREGSTREYDWLPMTSELHEALFQWRQDRPVKDTLHVFVCLEKTPFCEIFFGKPFSVRQHFMKKICEKSGVKPFGFHGIRHLTASILYWKGYSLGHIQAVLRHKNPNTTKLYLKSLGLEYVREALEEGLKRSAKVIKFEKHNKTGTK